MTQNILSTVTTCATNRLLMTRSTLIILYLCGLTRLASGNHCYGSTYQSCGACTNGNNCAWCPSSCSCVMAPDASRVCVGTFQTGAQSKCAAKCTLPTPPGEKYFTSISSKLKGNLAQVRAIQPHCNLALSSLTHPDCTHIRDIMASR